MSLFDFPYDIREKIWRRARFESARASVKDKLATRRQVLEHYIFAFNYYSVQVFLQINESKEMSIENSTLGKFIDVRFHDSSSVHLSYDPIRVSFKILANYTTSHRVYRKENIDHVPKETHTCSNWYLHVNSSRYAPGTTIRIYKI